MRKAESERKGGGLTYGVKEGEPFNRAARLAQILWHAGLKHWDEAFQLPDWQFLQWKIGVGLVHLGWLRNFQSQIENQRIQSSELDYHIVEVLPEKYPRRLHRGPFSIHGCPVFFPSPQTNWAIENLLRGKRIKGEAFLKGLTTVGDLREDLDFLNRYFNLGLELQEIDSREYRLAIPKTTKVVENPALFEVPAFFSEN